MIFPLTIDASFSDSQSPKSRKHGIYVNLSHFLEKEGDFKTLTSFHGAFFQIPNKIFSAYWHTCVHTHRNVKNSIKKSKTKQQKNPNQPTHPKKNPWFVMDGFLKEAQESTYCLYLKWKWPLPKNLNLTTKPTLFLIKIMYYIKGCSKIFRISVSWQQEVKKLFTFRSNLQKSINPWRTAHRKPRIAELSLLMKRGPQSGFKWSS